MKIFIDSADIDEIKQAYQWGIAEGVTTNPSLLKQAISKRKRDRPEIKDYLKQILKTAKGTPVSLEVSGTSTEEMVAEGKRLYQGFNHVAKNVCIKIPINSAFKDEDENHFEALAAIRELSQAKIPVNCTLVFTPEQALLAAKAGARYVSPFAGRIDDHIRTQNKIDFKKEQYSPAHGWMKENIPLNDNGIVSGIDLVKKCTTIMKNYGFNTEVLAASIRNPRQAREAALVGVDIATLPFSVIQGMVKHHQSFEGIKKFTADIVPDYQAMAPGHKKGFFGRRFRDKPTNSPKQKSKGKGFLGFSVNIKEREKK